MVSGYKQSTLNIRIFLIPGGISSRHVWQGKRVNETKYKTSYVKTITKLTARQLDYWASTGLLTPGTNPSPGRGKHRLYTEDDVVDLLVLAKLRKAGWSTQKLRVAVATMRNIRTRAGIHNHTFMVDAKTTIAVVHTTEDGETKVFDALSMEGQQIMSIVLELSKVEEPANEVGDS
jgi:DNA-binding transcriptional MerR regulator